MRVPQSTPRMKELPWSTSPAPQAARSRRSTSGVKARRDLAIPDNALPRPPGLRRRERAGGSSTPAFRRPTTATTCRRVPRGHAGGCVRRGAGTVSRTHLFGRLTREALLSYYSELAPVIIPHLRRRAFVSILGSRPGVRGTYLK